MKLFMHALLPLMTVVAAPTGAAVAQMVDVSPCRGIVDNQSRLICYDQLKARTSPTSSTAVEPLAGEAPLSVAAVAPTQSAESKMPAASGSRVSEGPVTSALVQYSRQRNGKILLVLANGDTWRQTDSRRVRIVKGQPIDVTIEPGAFGSYWLKVQHGGGTFRAEKVE